MRTHGKGFFLSRYLILTTRGFYFRMRVPRDLQKLLIKKRAEKNAQGVRLENCRAACRNEHNLQSGAFATVKNPTWCHYD